MFDEADAVAIGASEADDTVALPAPTQPQPEPATHKPRGKRKPLPAELPRVDIIHELPAAERTCSCGTPMVEIGEDISEQLDIVPMQIRVLRHIRKRYGCPAGQHAPVSAPAPAQVLPKSNASNDLLAMLLTAKYVDGLPLARVEYVLGRSEAIVPRQTLARWVIGTAQALQPVFNLLRDTLLESTVIHMDEMPEQVLKEAGRTAQSQSEVIYSLIEMAWVNGLEPYTWLRRALRCLPEARMVEQFEALLPWKVHAIDLATDSLG